MAARDPSHVVMIGTDPRTRGGISSVIRNWRAAGLFERWPVDYVVTHRDGTRREKLAAAWQALAACLALGWRNGRGVLHVHAASRWSFWRKSVYMAAALAAGWPVVFHLHGGGFARFLCEESGPVARRIVRLFLDRAAAIVVPSERWAAWMRRVTSNPRIVMIPNSVTLPALSSSLREPGLVAFAGRCGEGKGLFDLLEAVAALAPRAPHLRLECAGEGDLDAVLARARALGIAERLVLRGWIAPRERDELLARAWVFVLPSRAEALPMSVLEAMAAACAVVATAVGGIPDVVRHGVNGLLVPPAEPGALAEALAALLSDPGRAARLGRAARATIAERYTVDRAVERLEQVYGALGIPRGRARAPVAARRLQEIS
ncbi:MAG TPA: glycosyltransferase family 4 protein [Usitatibacter sp.]|nr:glycosyltransferase family 4 protein [Usitatibacter sp.]